MRFVYFKFGIKSYPFISKDVYLVVGIVLISLIICVIGHFIYVFISKGEEDEKNEELIEIIETEDDQATKLILI